MKISPSKLVKKTVLEVKWYIAGQILFSAISSLFLSIIPALNRYFVDNVLMNKGNIAVFIVVYVCCYVFHLATIWISERFVWKSAISFENSLKKKCFEKLLNMPYKLFSKKQNGEYLSLLSNNVTRVEQDYLQPICALVKSIIAIIIYAILIYINTTPIICISLIMLSALASVSPLIYKRRLKETNKKYVDQVADYTKDLEDMLDSFDMRDSKSAVAFARENGKITDKVSSKRNRFGKTKVNSNIVSGIAVYMVDIAIMILSVVLCIHGKITIGIVLAAITYSHSLMDPIQEVLYDINTLNSSKDIVRSLDEIVDRAGSCQGGSRIEPVSWIQLNNVNVKFGNRTLTYQCKFQIGKKYLITGKSGFGKTTLTKIIFGFHEYNGDVLIDGRPGTVSADACALCSQNQHVFHANFIDNVSLFGAYPFDENERLLGAIPLYHKIRRTEDCSTLSGGEKQILKICRALVQDKSIIFMDEPFAGLDEKNAEELFVLLTSVHRTIILISHSYNFHAQLLEKWEHINIEEICHG